MIKSSVACLFLWIRLLDVACPGNVVHGNVLEFRKDHDVINGDSGFTTFIVRIGSLPYVKEVSNLLLGKSMIFSYFPYAFVIFHQITTSKTVYWKDVIILTNRVINSKIRYKGRIRE